MKIIKWIDAKRYKNIFKYVPRVCTDVVVFNNKNEILLAKRGIPPGKGKWHIPGGGIRKGERVVQAAINRIKSETGLKVRIDKLVGITDNQRCDPRWHNITLVFRAKVIGGELKASKDNQEVRFFNAKKLPRMMFDHNKEIDYARKGRFYLYGLK